MNPTTTFEGGRLKIYYANQVAVQPPTFVLFVNDPSSCISHKRYLENCLRDRFGFEGTPIHIICRLKLTRIGRFFCAMKFEVINIYWY